MFIVEWEAAKQRSRLAEGSREPALSLFFHVMSFEGRDRHWPQRNELGWCNVEQTRNEADLKLLFGFVQVTVGHQDKALT